MLGLLKRSITLLAKELSLSMKWDATLENTSPMTSSVDRNYLLHIIAASGPAGRTISTEQSLQIDSPNVTRRTWLQKWKNGNGSIQRYSVMCKWVHTRNIGAQFNEGTNKRMYHKHAMAFSTIFILSPHFPTQFWAFMNSPILWINHWIWNYSLTLG